jgi:predicted AAA+ superfamily ATPase
LLPIGVCELMQSQTPFELMGQIESFLLYGMYPERFSLTHRDELIAYLAELSSAYLYKDVLELANIRYSSKIFKLLQLLAFQIGSEVSLIELSRSLEMSKETVSHYLDLLEQSFVLFRLSGFSRNLRKEVTRMDKIYFWDTGIRNALIDNFLPLAHRNDKGALWENFLIAERIKMRAYRQLRGRSYFWRTYDQSEVDYVEETDGQLKAFEFKFQPQPIKPPQAFLNHYPDAVFSGVHTENFLSFLE